MFEQFFGNYLIDKKKLTLEQFAQLMKQQKETRAKLGLIAVSENLLTIEQADEVNRIQVRLDKRFGDIAIDKEYLTSEQVIHLLSQQGNPYMIFLQNVIENEFLLPEELEKCIIEYQKENGFTKTDMENLKSGDTDRIVPIFMPQDHAFYFDYVNLTMRMLVRLLNVPFHFGKAERHNTYSFEFMGSQTMEGAHDFLIGLAGNGKSLLEIANPFAKEDFLLVDEDAFDSICEFINCINGLFASTLGGRNIDIDMCPPVYYKNQTIHSKKGYFYVVPLYFNRLRVDLIVLIDLKYQMIPLKQ